MCRRPIAVAPRTIPGSVVADRPATPVRAATAADIAEMHRVRLSVRENRLAEPGRVQPHHYVSMLETGRGWVSEVAGTIVGFAIADLAGGSLWALFVDPEYERRGIGRQLHDTAIAWLFASGAERIWLTTDPGTRAERFYQSAAWQRSGVEASGEVRYERSRGVIG
jgi:GNAT superfamily N-acetyltransferase